MPICVFTAKIGISGAFNGVYLSSPALFPPRLLSTAFGLCNVFARAVTIVAPMVAEVEGAVPMILMCSLSLASLVLVPMMIIPKPQKTAEETSYSNSKDAEEANLLKSLE